MNPKTVHAESVDAPDVGQQSWRGRPNTSRGDRAVRLVVATVLAMAAWFAGLATSDGVALTMLATAIVVTAITGRCPLYRLTGFSTATNGNRDSPYCTGDSCSRNSPPAPTGIGQSTWRRGRR